jgi:glycosyltransferase involved in cell wall biosynthesis
LLAEIATQRNITYLGELSIERVNEEIAQSDIFVNTSSEEGFPNTFIQAWMRGVPVVSCFVDPDNCLSNKGIGICIGGSEGLAEAIAALADNPRRLARLAIMSRDHALANHHIGNVEQLINILLRRGSPGHDAGKELNDG